MDALILSCSTGGGHNAAAHAVKEELELRGHNATLLDPYQLAGKNLDRKVGNGYIKIAQRTPNLFGVIYKLGDEYRRLPIHSPVYAVNKAMLGKMQSYLNGHHFDVVMMTHVFPAEILTYMKNKGLKVPKMIFIATDYVCIPFTEEADCDYYVIPAKELEGDFIRHGIDRKRLVPAGIPVKREFSDGTTRDEAIEQLGLDKSKRYLLLSGGSIGAGQIENDIRALCGYMQQNPEYRLIVICGNNEKLLDKLRAGFGSDERVTLLASTDKIALYMKACDVYLSKPGGLSSTEAAVSGTPLIHVSPIPGCENKNMDYFEKRGMSIAAGNDTDLLISALERLKNKELISQMIANQRTHINPNAAKDICDLAERIAKGENG